MDIVKKTRANQITLPKRILKRAHLEKQEHFKVDLVGGGIYLVPLTEESPLTKEEEALFLEKLNRLAKGERARGRKFTSGEDLKHYLNRLTR